MAGHGRVPAWALSATVEEIRRYWEEGALDDQVAYLLSKGQVVPADERQKARERLARDRHQTADRIQVDVDVALELLRGAAGALRDTLKKADAQRARMDELVRAAAANQATSREIAEATGLTPQMVNVILRGRPAKGTGQPPGRPGRRRRTA